MKITNIYKDDQIIINSIIVNEWISKFFEMIKLLGLPFISPSFTSGIVLEFSDKEIKTQEAQYDFDSIKKEILELIPDSVRAIVNNSRDSSELYCKLEELYGKGFIEESLFSKYQKMLKKAPHFRNYSSIYKAGDYSYWQHRITLYYNVIKRDTFKGKPRIQAFEEVFIHELFHAYHYAIAEKKGLIELKERTDYTSRVVKESLAAYFELKYCNHYGIETNIEDDWHVSPCRYPYSGAKRIKEGYLNRIFEKSCENLDDALREMLEENEFYDVKNIVEYSVIKVSVPSKPSGLHPSWGGAPIITIPPTITKKKRKNKQKVLAVINELRTVGRLTAHTSDVLSDVIYTQIEFGISSFPVLKEKGSITAKESKHYYVSPIITIDGIEYSVVNHWVRDSLDRFIEWKDYIINLPKW